MKKLLTSLVLMLTLVVLAACGGEEATDTDTSGGTTSGGTTSGGSALVIDSAEGAAIAYAQTALSAPAGEVTITFNNKGSIPHNVTIVPEGQEATADAEAMSSGAPDYLAASALAQTKMLNGGASETITANLQPGTYTYFCSFPGHLTLGMKGTLTVQ